MYYTMYKEYTTTCIILCIKNILLHVLYYYTLESINYILMVYGTIHGILD